MHDRSDLSDIRRGRHHPANRAASCPKWPIWCAKRAVERGYAKGGTHAFGRRAPRCRIPSAENLCPAMTAICGVCPSRRAERYPALNPSPAQVVSGMPSTLGVGRGLIWPSARTETGPAAFLTASSATRAAAKRASVSSGDLSPRTATSSSGVGQGNVSQGQNLRNGSAHRVHRRPQAGANVGIKRHARPVCPRLPQCSKQRFAICRGQDGQRNSRQMDQPRTCKRWRQSAAVCRQPARGRVSRQK